MNDFVETESEITPHYLQGNENLNNNTNQDNKKYVIYLVNKAPGENSEIINDLILDNWGDYYYDYRSTELNSVVEPLRFNSNGFSFILSSLNDDRYVKINLYKTHQDRNENLIPPRDLNKRYLYIDISNGFKLSQIMNNLLDIDQISLDGKLNGENFDNISEPELTITQKINLERYDSFNRVTFIFNISSLSVPAKIVLPARRVLFKDILPQGVLFKGVLLNGKHYDDECINLNGRRLFIKLPVIKDGESIEISIVCLIDKVRDTGLNVGALTYVSNNLLNKQDNTLTTNVYTLLSNALNLEDMI
ncbi:hypothetical protein [Candidatus Arthromitus sp. SFB-rat-Yit]|uniref:hypothetical protein n=1 Tax=Candidatus Arthromitus sp. SFB-rat-Yit TaxID=1041504 RepID=UPI000227A749|nr:hypothetical protein [Candidatus Arthromitus sp. SFB-rat-Yit]BAK80669.1 hypothetical protein RATSFB_0107 [Candidatus Arthromitus sp. SFB-rat-Yit]